MIQSNPCDSKLGVQAYQIDSSCNKGEWGGGLHLGKAPPTQALEISPIEYGVAKCETRET